MTFVQEARRSAATWKKRTPALPDAARESASYRGGDGPGLPFCLPVELAKYNLLPEARDHGLQRFAELEIPWHHGRGGMPSNHLLSSQVQCVNALAPFATNRDGVRQLFGDVLDIVEPLEFGGDAIDATDLIVFEWIGETDYLDETPAGRRTRGANTTSADAAIRYRTSRGTIEVALIEWKYTERYGGHELSDKRTSMDVRHGRYRPKFDDPDGPVRNDLLPFEDFFVEPFYQLFRLQLLASQMERAGEHGAERVRVVYVAPQRNAALWESLNRTSHVELAACLASADDPLPVLAVWQAHLRQPERFIYMDSAALIEGDAPTSAEFRDRYDHLGGEARAMPFVATRIAVDVPLTGWDLSYDGPWATWLATAWLAATTPAATIAIPAAPRHVSGSRPDSIAWWTPLPHLLGYALGWLDYERGLRSWFELGRPTSDPRLALIDQWWGPSAEAFAVWIATRRDDDSSNVDRFLELAARTQDHRDRLPLLESLLTGGGDSLHLQTHAPIPGMSHDDDTETATPTQVIGPDVNGRASVTFPHYQGWYQALDRVAKNLGDDRHAVLAVRCDDVGYLGEYRKSPVTHRWFNGSHAIHLLGANDCRVGSSSSSPAPLRGNRV